MPPALPTASTCRDTVPCNSRSVTSTPRPPEIAREIARRDRAFRHLIDAVGPPPVRRSARVDTRFATLVRSITYQLLATKAAETIHARVIDACDGAVTPETVLDAGHDRLRAAGLSHAKSAAMIDLAERTLDGRLDLGRHGRMSDDEVARDVVAVRGIGLWTAQMYLMHTLGRHDVWPVGDLGVRHGWSILHGLDEVIDPKDLQRRGERFDGMRSDVAWYCWRAVHRARER